MSDFLILRAYEATDVRSGKNESSRAAIKFAQNVLQWDYYYWSHPDKVN